MNIIIDTNFILTCVKQKIDFIYHTDKIFDKSISWMVPLEVIKELKQLSERKGEKTRDKEAAKLSLDIIKQNSLDITPLSLKPNESVDDGIVRYIKQRASGKSEIVLATMDKELKKRLKPVKILTIRGKNNLDII